MNKTLKSCCRFQEGYVNPSQKDRSYFGGEIKWLRSMDLNNGRVFDTSQHLTQKGFDSAGKSAYMFPKHSIAISKSGTIGELGILEDEMCGNRAVINIVVDENTADFMYVFYTLMFKKKEIISKAVGSIQKNLYISALETIEIEELDKTKQKRISKILSSIDEKIENNNKINSELESMAKTIYDYWFLQFEFPNEEGKPYKSSGGKMVWNEELKREIPEGWEVLPLSEIADYQNGHAFYKDGYDESGARIVDLGNVNLLGMYIDTKDDKFICIDRYERDEYTKFRVVKNDLVMIMTDRKSTMDLLGKTGKIYKEERYLLNQRVARIRCKKEFNVNYLYATLNGSFVNDMLKGRALGSVQKYVNSGDIESLPILIPSNRVIKQFEEIVDDSYERMEEALRENEQLSSLRDFLLPLLMNGQVGFKS